MMNITHTTPHHTTPTITSLYLHEQVKGEAGQRPTHHLTKGCLLGKRNACCRGWQYSMPNWIPAFALSLVTLAWQK